MIALKRLFMVHPKLIFFTLGMTLMAVPGFDAARAESGNHAPEASRLALLGSVLSRGAHAVHDFDPLATPSQELTKPHGNADRGEIVLVQSKRDLGQGLANNTVRLDQLEEQIRRLTGQIEQLTFENKRLQEQIILMQEDAEARLSQLESGKRSDLGDTTTNHASADSVPPLESQEGGTDADLIGELVVSGQGAAVEPATGSVAPPLDLGKSLNRDPKIAQGASVESDAVPQSRDPLLQPNGIASLGTLPSGSAGDAEALYNLGYTQILNGDYIAAEKNLRQFIQLYPSHPLAANAQYWLGETYYARGQFSDAVAEFSQNYKTFPESSKAPESLLKLGLSLARLDEHAAACATLAEMFNRYPNASRSVQLAARDEQARSNCS